MSDQRCSDSDQSKRDIPSFIEPRPPLISNPFMRPRPQKGTNLLELFDEDSETDEAEWVQVYLRLKPCNVRSNLYEVKSDRCLITSVDTATAGHGRATQHNVSKMYTFSHIFGPESSQKEIFEHVVKENLKKLPDGHNFTLLTYGASGSGKTYTLMGTVASPGLVPRSLEYVFRLVDAARQPLYKPADAGADKLSYSEQEYELQLVKRMGQVSAPLRDKYRRMSAQLRNDLTTSTLDLSNRTRYYVWVSFVEIYNQAIYDLLTNCDRSKATSKLRIREDSTGNVYVKGSTQVFVRTGEEAYDVLVAGKHNLQVAATGVHAQSSRSHCIFTITMLTETDSGVRTSYVRLCDLAGSERARNTCNTGARMQESRAINSSLHVLERCLHMLRRKQRGRLDATQVPYRESKLTRLLGAGLSGVKGEALSMVVTLNPSPKYMFETKHVLQLAAVARDIQVNMTMAEYSVESSTQDTTITCSAEVMKLRADNERLHFELVQAQTRNKELMECMEEKQREVAKTMAEMVEEAKDMTRQYYEAQLQSMRAEMEDMQEEYENELKTIRDRITPIEVLRSSDVGTPSKAMQRKVAKLSAEIAVLEEKLSIEREARAKAEEEVIRLRTTLQERDDKPEKPHENPEDVISVTDSESEDEDSCNESLEPTFRKEDIDRSILLQNSLINDTEKDKNYALEDKENNSHDDTAQDMHSDDENIDNSLVEKSGDTLKYIDDSHDDAKESDYITGESGTGDKNDISEVNLVNDNPKADISEIINEISSKSKATQKSNLVRGTYFVRNSYVSDNSTDDVSSDNYKSLRDTYCVTDTEISNTSDNFAIKDDGINISIKNLTVDEEKSTSNVTETVLGEKPTKVINKLFDNVNHNSDISLAQFEQLELAANDNEPKINTTLGLSNINILKEKRTYFDNNLPKDAEKPKQKTTNFDNIDVNIDKIKKPYENRLIYYLEILPNDDRSPSIVKEDVTNNFEPSTIKKLLGESFTRQSEVLSSVPKAMIQPKKPVSVDIFEGFDSPNILSKAIEKKDSTDITQKSIEKPTGLVNTANKTNFITEAPISNEIDNASKSKETLKDVFTDSLNSPPFMNEISGGTVKKRIPTKDVQIKIERSAENQKLALDNIVESTRKFIDKMVSDQKVDTGKTTPDIIKIKVELPSIVDEAETQQFLSSQEPINHINNETNPQEIILSKSKEIVDHINDTQETRRHSKDNNTIDEFENIYKELTVPRATEFDLLISQTSSSHIDDITNDTQKKTNETEKEKYNLRHKLNTSEETKQKEPSQEVLLENKPKCESSRKPIKRNLRLRRRKDQSNERMEQEETVKLKDIVNLQKEFSDVTMDVPAPKKDVKDVQSPEKVSGQEENVPPLPGIQSCPSKSVTRSRRKLFTPRPEPLEESLNQTGDSTIRVTRSRRKLFTPRPEPLEESLNQTGDSTIRVTRSRRKLFTPRPEPLEESLNQTGDSNERICVPRPSYHRTRARRKL